MDDVTDDMEEEEDKMNAEEKAKKNEQDVIMTGPPTLAQTPMPKHQTANEDDENRQALKSLLHSMHSVAPGF